MPSSVLIGFVALVDSNSFSGSYSSNPFLLDHFNCDYIKAVTGLDRESAHPMQLHAMKRSRCTAANPCGTDITGLHYL